MVEAVRPRPSRSSNAPSVKCRLRAAEEPAGRGARPPTAAAGADPPQGPRTRAAAVPMATDSAADDSKVACGPSTLWHRSASYSKYAGCQRQRRTRRASSSSSAVELQPEPPLPVDTLRTGVLEQPRDLADLGIARRTSLGGGADNHVVGAVVPAGHVEVRCWRSRACPGAAGEHQGHVRW
jgi:hypothetical protein